MRKFLKIASCIDFYGYARAGAEVDATEINKRLVKRGHKVEIIASKSPFSKPQPITKNHPIHYGWGLYQMREISRIVPTKPLSDFFYRFPGWIYQRNVVKYLKEDYDLICTFSFDILQTIIHHNVQTPVVFTLHNPPLARYQNLLKRPNCLVVRSKDVALRIKQDYNLKSMYIPCGCDFEKFKPRDRKKAKKRLGFSVEEQLLLFVGRLIPFKNCEGLIKTFPRILSQLPEARLLVIGQGVLRQHLEKLAKALNIDSKVHFLGNKEPDELPLYYNAANLFIAPSFYEAFSMVSLEAIASETPTIISKGMKEFRGFFPELKTFNPESPNEIAQVAIKCLKSKNFSLKRNGLRIFDWQNITFQYEKIFQEVNKSD